MKHFTNRISALASTVLISAAALGNNIQVSNTTLTNNTGTTVQVQFDLSWEHSWRGVGMPNWDAAWVFVKYRNGAGVWSHANLTATGHVVPSGATLDLGLVDNTVAYDAITNPYVGGFLYRDADGVGTFSLTGVQLQWDYSALGLTYTDIAQVQVFAIEMVYVSQGAFFVGSGGSEIRSLTNGSTTVPPSVPFQITSEAAINAATSAGSLWSLSGAMTAGTIPAAFPKGFAAFYCMKYQLSQQGYVDFLNTLTFTQQLQRGQLQPTNAVGSGPFQLIYRNSIDIQATGANPGTPAIYACNLNGDANFGDATDGKDLVMNYMSTTDLLAYLDWSGLRPMSELEYEKACRGTAAPVPNEYAWGMATANAINGVSLTNPGAANEGIATGYSTTIGNYSTGNVARRVGIYAANPGNSGRVTAGASFYGIMELSGSVCDPAVQARNASGRIHTGLQGNGALAANGNTDVATWSPSNLPWRGGYYGSGSQVSYGGACGSNGPCTTGRDQNTGGRGVRTAP
ncbi:MAG: hypothetical protein IPM12_12925 [Flavobacteriales bacterium]|nr:hypothetical protein [Flavobacteriales bacterium]